MAADSEVATILLPTSAFLITLLLAVIGFFTSRVLIKVDDTIKILGTFNARIEVLVKSIDIIEKNYTRFSEESTNKYHELEREIEMLRNRTHQLTNWLLVLRLKMEKNGEKFSSSEWSLVPPKME